MDLQNNFTQLDKNLQEVLEKWDKKCTSGGCFCCPPEWEKAETEVLLLLIIWAMPELQQFLAECFLAGKKETVNCPVYEKCKIYFLQIKEMC